MSICRLDGFCLVAGSASIRCSAPQKPETIPTARPVESEEVSEVSNEEVLSV